MTPQDRIAAQPTPETDQQISHLVIADASPTKYEEAMAEWSAMADLARRLEQQRDRAVGLLEDVLIYDVIRGDTEKDIRAFLAEIAKEKPE